VFLTTPEVNLLLNPEFVSSKSQKTNKKQISKNQKFQTKTQRRI
jgi:hypothetical protein